MKGEKLMSTELGYRERANLLLHLLETGRPNAANRLRDVLAIAKYDPVRNLLTVPYERQFRMYFTIECVHPAWHCLEQMPKYGFTTNPECLRGEG